MDVAGSRKIEERINSMRGEFKLQERATEIQGFLCDEIRAATPPEIKEAIEALRDTNPELHSYIQKLQWINAGIYCYNCKKIKETVIGEAEPPNRPASTLQRVAPVETVATVDAEMTAFLSSISAEIKALRSEHERLSGELSKIESKFHAAEKKTGGEAAPSVPANRNPYLLFTDDPIDDRFEQLLAERNAQLGVY